jgi:hypothetical protein
LLVENLRPAPGSNYAPTVYAPRHEDIAPFRAANRLDGMQEVQLPNRPEMVFPSGAIYLTTTGALFAPPLEAIPLAEWRLAHAEEWYRRRVRDFEDCRRQAQANPTIHDWVSDLVRLRDAVLHAQKNLAARRADLEQARDPGGVMAKANEAIREQIQRDSERRERERMKALAAIDAITIGDGSAPDDDE